MTISYDKQVLIKRGNTASVSTYTGPLGELVLDTDTSAVYVHDGVTVGGNPVGNGVGSNYGNTNVNSYLQQFNGNIIPSANVTYSLGNSTHQWKDLWVSNNTIYINSIPISVNTNNNLLVNNVPVVTYENGSLNAGGNAVSGGTPTISNTVKGFINLVGDRPNNNNDCAFESVVVRGQYAYVLGSDRYISNSSGRSKIYKFDVETGAQVWVKQIAAGRDATFNLIIGSGTTTANVITGSSGSWEMNPMSNIATTGGSGTGMRVDVTESGGYASTITVSTSGEGYINGETITVTSGSSNATFTIDVVEDVVIDAVVSGGTGYKVGEEIVIEGVQLGGGTPANNVTLVVATLGGNNSVLTATVKPGYDVTGITATYSGLASYYDDARGDVCAIAYDEYNDVLVVVTEYDSGRSSVEDNYWSWANVYAIDPVTGAVLETATLSEEGDIYPNSIATYNGDGKVAIVGEKYNEYREFGNLTMLNKADGYFDILKSELDPDHYPGSPFENYSDFWVTGTGITRQENVDNVNYYTNLTSTTRQGTGTPLFQIADNGDGTYGVGTVTTADSANYRVGHKIKVLGTSLGGVTPDNDCVVIVTEINGSGGITGVIIGSGTAAGGAYTLYNSVSGTNYNVGSGATYSLYINAATGLFTFDGFNSQGSNYAAGDVLTIAGTQFVQGTSPANNATIVVSSVNGDGAITSLANNEPTGTGPTTALRILVTGVDFTAEGGAWAMRQNLGGEAFVWTPEWTNAIGGGNTDRFYDVTWNEDGTALYAVGRGRYEVAYQQALVVKFDAADGSIIWSKDIKFDEADDQFYDPYRQNRAVCMVPNSSDIMVGGEWYDTIDNRSEIILTRMTSAGAAVWQKTYSLESEGGEEWIDPEISLKASGNRIIMSFDQATNVDGRGFGYLVIDPADGTVDRHRVVSADGNSNYVYYNTPTANFADIYTDGLDNNYVIMAGYTYVPTDNYYNALLMKLPIDGLVNIAVNERWSLGEHIMNRYTANITTVTSGFDSFVADEHINTIATLGNARNYVTRAPDGNLNVWTQTLTNDTEGYLEFGDGSKQSFATNVIPQILGANDYLLTTQDSGKHIFFEHENGTVYIPHSSLRYFPIGFTFTVVNTTGNDCFLRSQSGPTERAIFKLAGRNITTIDVGIPDSGSGSIVTVMKIKDGYSMTNSANDADYPDAWIVSGPGDLYNND